MSRLFQVENMHVDDCGVPPSWVLHGDGGRRFYGESELGEQMVAEVSPELFRFAMGDRGWDKPVIIKKPRYARLLTDVLERLTIPGHFPSIGASRSPLNALILGESELMWLTSPLSVGKALQALHPGKRAQQR